MASNRHLGRILALQTLYELDFRSNGLVVHPLKEILARNLKPYKKTVDDVEFVKRLTEGVHGRFAELDGIIAPIAPEWPVDQISRIDKVILRMAIWELQSEKDTPAKVVINEAVELAKAFGSDSSSKFVNGVLGTVYTQFEEADKKAQKVKKAKKEKTK